ncbi:ATP-binding protein [Rhizobium binxianense]|uniref:ATP-binding protein n=1 Tax=Rhizobium binxianense TaxID=3024242 RepID=UPI00235F3616|nr:MULTISPECIES: ATP-binding protein [unclassified Rhizobium]MDC9808495.1 ATP-binding protein [Rhizobium sp. MC62]WEA60475.1 ATP-binding protein [Rhizobium sp. BJ04]
MITQLEEEIDATLILAAEECPPADFANIHKFSSHDDVIIRKLVAHGPVLIRGGRGSGKSALLLEAHRRMRELGAVIPVYVSLRYLPLLQSDGDEYVMHFCQLLSKKIQEELAEQQHRVSFPVVNEVASLQQALSTLAQFAHKRVVLLFDDAAHIGREKPLEVFFDLFRTISSSLVSCKASIYPGVTKFGTRFDVYNDSTVLEISRSDVAKDKSFFLEVLKARYPNIALSERFSERLSPEHFANLIGRAVVGNMRGFILACNRFDQTERISIPDVNTCLLALATDYYWPLMDEVAPKLGVYEPLIEPARDLVEAIVDHAVKASRGKAVSQDRVLIHRQFLAQFGKIFEVLEYLGFISRREASRAMKSGGRGAVFAINLCNLLDKTPSQRLSIDAMEQWIAGTPEISEIHVSSNTFQSLTLPTLADESGELAILTKPVGVLAKSTAYPYGLTEDKIGRLRANGYLTVGQVAKASDYQLKQVYLIGPVTVRRIRYVVAQAIWM